MSDERLTAEDEQCLLMEEPAADMADIDTTVIYAGTLRALLREIRLAWRVRSAMGMNEWPTEGTLRTWEGRQTAMQREYDAENAKDPQ